MYTKIFCFLGRFFVSPQNSGKLFMFGLRSAERFHMTGSDCNPHTKTETNMGEPACEAQNLALYNSHFYWRQCNIPGSWGCQTTRGCVKRESLIRDWQAVANVWSFRWLSLLTNCLRVGLQTILHVQSAASANTHYSYFCIQKVVKDKLSYIEKFTNCIWCWKSTKVQNYRNKCDFFFNLLLGLYEAGRGKKNGNHNNMTNKGTLSQFWAVISLSMGP